ncbi:MAG: hypothetical protein KBS38_02895 [Bacteroidales bacterium]|nr:hypothetical protein [Candidatus Cacconaster caballi]
MIPELKKLHSACRKAGEDSTSAAGKPLSGKCVLKRNFSRLGIVFREGRLGTSRTYT